VRYVCAAQVSKRCTFLSLTFLAQVSAQSGYVITLRNCKSAIEVAYDHGAVELYRYGFHPHPRFRTDLKHTHEYALDGGFFRPVWALLCMTGMSDVCAGR
jgi:hypothetical protein